ncbi:hypothetical protein H0H87_007021 [Tephrocybe sp. NHM501043]|nr:hypothetical protein H0H87_007021 [Tephrocybe sp. NHM501043]
MALRYTSHGLKYFHLRSVLNENFEAAYRDHETGQAYITWARRLYMVTGDLIRMANFSNPEISNVLGALQDILCERYNFYTPPVSGAPGRRALAEQGKAEALDILEDLQWHPDLLRKLLDDDNVNWENKAERKD